MMKHCKYCSVTYILSLIILSSWTSQARSSIFVDWSLSVPQDVIIKEFIVYYSPSVGEPPPNSTVGSSVHKIEVKQTVPAIMYRTIVSALLDKFQTITIYNKSLPSTPEIPLIDAVEPGIKDATIFLFPMEDQEQITFFVEYSPLSNTNPATEKRNISMVTNDTVISLNDLEPDTMYEIRVHSVFQNLRSLMPSRTKFKTKKLTVVDNFETNSIEEENKTEIVVKPNKKPELVVQHIFPDREVMPQNVDFSTEGRQLRVNWDPPVDMDCNEYRLNYTLTTLSKPKSFTIDVQQRTYALIKMFQNHTIQADVWCLKNGTLVGKRPGTAEADLRRPDPVQNLRIVELVTDENFRSRIVLAWDWPDIKEDEITTDEFSVLLSYFPGKAKAQRKDIMVNYTTPVNITNLKPTELYTFTIVNISRFDVRSRIKGLTQIMPPVISSTLLPGEVTSTTMLITFSQTDVDQAVFDHYLLIACISETVNATLNKSKADKNRQFLLKNLIPGQSYKFVLHTVYRGVKSSPVIAHFTTYPLKVKKIRPLVRQSSVKLMWEPEETTITEISYKASYTGSDGFESEPILVEKREYHIFEELKPEIWYTFSVTVLMNDQESESEAQTVVTGRKSDPTPTLLSSTPTTLKISFTKDIFTESNGVVENYTLIMTEDYRLDKFSHTLPNWEHVQDKEIWPPYRTTPYGFNPFSNPRDTETTFIVGEEKCTEKHPGEVCNGPLKPRTLYYIKLRGCTREEVCMETSYTKVATEKELPKGSDIVYLNWSSRSKPLVILNFVNLALASIVISVLHFVTIFY